MLQDPSDHNSCYVQMQGHDQLQWEQTYFIKLYRSSLRALGICIYQPLCWWRPEGKNVHLL